jgi:hypothetical protein
VAPNKANVKRLIDAAWTGMKEELLVETASAEDVVNATVAIAAGGIRYACSAATGADAEGLKKNRDSVQTCLQQLLLDTADDLKVM